MPSEAAGTMDAVGQEPRRPVSALPGLEALPGEAGRAFGMEISQGGGIDVPGVPSSVPSLFPVSGEWFHRVPYVPCVRRSRYEHSFLYSLLARRGTLGTLLTLGTG